MPGKVDPFVKTFFLMMLPQEQISAPHRDGLIRRRCLRLRSDKEYERHGDGGGYAEENPCVMIASRRVKYKARQGRTDQAARPGRSQHEADQAAEGLPTEVLPEDRPPEVTVRSRSSTAGLGPNIEFLIRWEIGATRAPATFPSA